MKDFSRDGGLVQENVLLRFCTKIMVRNKCSTLVCVE
jgi:hypothetical protein